MGVQIEELKAVFTAQYSGYLRGVRAVQDAAKNLERNATTAAKRMSDAWRQSQKVFQAAGAEMQKVGTAVNNSLNRMAVAATGIATKAAVSFGQFELTMKRAGAVTRTLGTVDFQRLDEAAKEMGRTTVYSASQAAAAIEQMGLAGLTQMKLSRRFREHCSLRRRLRSISLRRLILPQKQCGPSVPMQLN